MLFCCRRHLAAAGLAHAARRRKQWRLARALAQVSDSYQRRCLASERLLTLLEPTPDRAAGRPAVVDGQRCARPGIQRAHLAGRQRMKPAKNSRMDHRAGRYRRRARPCLPAQPPHAVLPPTPKATPRYCAAWVRVMVKRSRVLIDLACETLHEQHTRPCAGMIDALAQQCRRNQFAADALRAGAGGRVWQTTPCCSCVECQWVTARLAASADTWRSPACGAVFSQLAGRAAGAGIAGASHGPALLLQPGLASARLSWLQDGWVRHSRQVGPAGEDISLVLDFLPASRITRPTASLPSLANRGGRQSGSPSSPGGLSAPASTLESGWPDLAERTAQPPTWRLSLATRHIAATTGAMFALQPPADPAISLAQPLPCWAVAGLPGGEALNWQAAQLAEHTRAPHASNQQLGSQPGPGRSHAGTPRRPEQPADIAHALATPGRRSGCLAEQLARRPALSVTALNWRRPCPA